MDGTPDPERLDLLFGGDTMLGRRVNEAIRREGFTYPLEAVVATTRAADLFLVNLECAITPRDIQYSGPEKVFYFRADPVAADTLTPGRLAREVEALAARVDHVIVAFHWQPNWVRRVSPFYRSLARQVVEAGARIVWGHSPHHFQGVEWIDNSVVLYATGDLVDDYRLVPEFRNDRQLLFQLLVSEQRVEQVRAYPLELKLARTRAADTEARQWITEHFRAMCGDLGSRVEQQGEWLGVLPG